MKTIRSLATTALLIAAPLAFLAVETAARGHIG